MKDAKKINIKGLADRVLDHHMDGNGDETTGEPEVSEGERAKIRDELREAIMSAVQTTSEENIPGNVKRMVRDMTECRINWRDLLGQQIQSTIKNDFSWMRP